MTVYRCVIWVRDYLASDDCTLSHPARELAWALASHVDSAAKCIPSVERLAKITDRHPGTVRAARAELVAAGVIEAELVAGGSGITNTYRFPFDSAGAAPLAVVHNPRRGTRVENPQPASPDAEPAWGDARTRVGGRDQVGKIEVEKTEVGDEQARRRDFVLDDGEWTTNDPAEQSLWDGALEWG